MTINRVNRVILVDFLEIAFLESQRQTRDLRDSRAEPTLQQTPKEES